MKYAWKLCLVCLVLLCVCTGTACADETITLPANLKVIEAEAFLNATGMKNVVVPEGAQEIGPRAFAGSSVKYIVIPASVTVIADDAFEGVTGLTVRGEEGSYAQGYCKEHGLYFTSTDPQPYPESEHPCKPNTDQTWTWSGRPDAKMLQIHFDSIYLYGDTLTFYDGDGRQVIKLDETLLVDEFIVTVPGNAFSLRLVTGDHPLYGFSIAKIEELTAIPDKPLRIVDVQREMRWDSWEECNCATWEVKAEGLYEPLAYTYKVVRSDPTGDQVWHEETIYTPVCWDVPLWRDGTYTMHITLTDAQGQSVTVVDEPIVVREKQMKLGPITSNITSGKVFDLIEWELACEGALYPLSLEYIVTKDGAEIKRETQTHEYEYFDFDSFSYDYKPTEAGTYVLTVHATDSWGSKVTAVSKPVTIEALWEPEILITTDCPNPVVGYPITWTVEVTNSKDSRWLYFNVAGPGKYAGDYLRTDDGTLTFTYTPDEPGDYAFNVSTSVSNGSDSYSVLQSSEGIRIRADYGTLSGDFYYQLNEANEATITNYAGTDWYVLIPETIDGHPVVAIGDMAFSPIFNYQHEGNLVITEVAIPDHVKSIGHNAFYQCLNLERVHIGNGVTSIGGFVFSGCEKLYKMNYPLNLDVNLSYSYMQGCPSLKSIVVPEGVTALPKSIFSETALEEITLPPNLVTIGDYAFYNATNLKTVNLPDSVTTIGRSAFRNCSALETIHYPRSLGSVGKDVFVGCTSMETITIPEGVTQIVPNIFKGCEGLCEVEFPSSLEKICSSAFAECANLSRIVMRNNLKVIEYSAFQGCISLKAVTIPNSVEHLGGFSDCTSLETVNIPLQWKTGTFFKGCPKLKKAVVPEGITVLPEWAFLDCDNLEEVYLPASLLEIGKEAFRHCDNLKDVHFQEGLYKIHERAFAYCISLKEADLPDSVSHMLDEIFLGCTALETFHYPLNWDNTHIKSVWPYHIYSSAHVKDCPNLKKIVIPEGVKVLPQFVMAFCRDIEEIVLPNSLLEIQDSAFAGCTNLRKANIPGSVVYIGKDAFIDCPMLNVTCEWGTMGYAYVKDRGIAHEYLTLHDAKYPKGTLELGKKFTFKGELQAHDKIHSLYAHVYTADGAKVLQGKITTPYDTVADLNDCFTKEFNLETLPEGRYLFRMRAVVNGKGEQIVVENTFDIVAEEADVDAEGISLPNTVYSEGEKFTFKGKITFKNKNGSLVARIIDQATNKLVRVYTFAGRPLDEAHDVSDIQSTMAFNELNPGSYTYRINAYIDGETYMVAESYFRIASKEEELVRAAKVDAALLGKSSQRNNDLLYESAILANRAYTASEARRNLKAMGFRDVADYYLSPGAHTIGHFIAWKDIIDEEGKATRAYVIVCRGTAPFLNEWMSNFTLASPDGYHHGFYQAAREVRRNFQAYVANHAPDKWAPQDYKVWIMGHSRGAAVANILGGDFLVNDGYTRSNVHTYTFACPNVFKGKAPTVNNVFNYNLGGDLVPRVPLTEWGYSRYGSTVTMPNGASLFGENLVTKENMDKFVEILAQVESIDTLESTFNQALENLSTHSVDEVFQCYFSTVYELLNEAGIAGSSPAEQVANLLELITMLKDAGPTHDSKTYIKWISNITGR